GQTRQSLTGIHDGSGEYEVEERKTGEHKVVSPHVPFQAELLPVEGNRRQRLAAWVTHPDNTHFAQATVNRVWALLFGRRFAEPVDDRFAAGDVPAVLKDLAADFAHHGYDLRRLIKVIAATEVFRLDSAADHEITDAHEKTWAVFPLTRLRPEQVV